jgi:NADH-quinone oxidoreductase subunit C
MADEPKVPPQSQPPAAKPPTPPTAAGGAAKAEHKPPAAAAPSGPPDPPPPADKPVPAFIAALQAAVPDGVTQVSYWVGDWTVIAPASRLLDVARHLRAAGFDFCSDVTATDWPQRPQRFDVVYSLYSIRDKQRVRVKVRAAEQERVPSVTAVWPAANWLEREVYDLFGVAFVGHPDLRRILMPEDWQGHPQRKDYPLEGPGELLMENPIEWLKLKQAAHEAEIE